MDWLGVVACISHVTWRLISYACHRISVKCDNFDDEWVTDSERKVKSSRNTFLLHSTKKMSNSFRKILVFERKILLSLSLFVFRVERVAFFFGWKPRYPLSRNWQIVLLQTGNHSSRQQWLAWSFFEDGQFVCRNF